MNLARQASSLSRRARRATALLAAWAFLAALCPPAAPARELMLEDGAEISTDELGAVGWTFTALTLLSIGYASYSYNQSQDELDEADKAYAEYRNATSEAEAVRLHGKVRDHHDQAQAAETRANIAIALTLVFALTAFYSFSPESAPDISITATTQGPRFEWRF